MRSAVRGRVLLPGDAGFDLAGQPWNLAVAQPVSGVVAVADAHDAADVVKFARSTNRQVVTQTTGHRAVRALRAGPRPSTPARRHPDQVHRNPRRPRPHITGSKPYTFLAPGETASAAFDPETLARLRQIKTTRDPHNIIRANFPLHH
ncbi:hypothetical protein AB0I35_31210 [Nocardia sp. NPDC050378]|uniref:hypothetical protein n=1 Tax=Nocardia sp. NPDC050378 TaxID=3155400 RepID=UPI0033E54E01